MESRNYAELIEASKSAHEKWRLVPAPQRGEIIRNFGNEIRKQKVELAKNNNRRGKKNCYRSRG